MWKIQILKLAAENLLKTPEMGASAIIRHEDTAQPIYLFKANNERDM